MRSIYSRFVRDYLVPDDRPHTEGHFKLTKGIRAIQKEMPDSKEEINTMIDTLKSHGLLTEVKKGATAIPFTTAIEVCPQWGSSSKQYGIVFTNEPIKALVDLNTNGELLKALDKDEMTINVYHLSGLKPLMEAVRSLTTPTKLPMGAQGDTERELHSSLQSAMGQVNIGFNGEVGLFNHEIREANEETLLSPCCRTLEDLALVAQVSLSEIQAVFYEAEGFPTVLHRGPYKGCMIYYSHLYSDDYDDITENDIDEPVMSWYSSEHDCKEWDGNYQK